MLAIDQEGPFGTGWYQVRWGLWRNSQTGEVWRSWRAYGRRAGHYPVADAARRAARIARAAETAFARSLRQVGQQITQMIRGTFDADNPGDPGWDSIEELLARYRIMIEPWAGSVARRMLADVSRRDALGWHQLGLEVNRALRKEIESAPTQSAMQDLYNYTVQKIVELPDGASERLRQSRAFSAEIIRQMRGSAEEAVIGGKRWEDLVKEVREAGLHVQSSASTVARTEVSRAHSVLQAVRAKHIGSELFQWISSRDAEVRPLHRELERRDVGYGRGIYRWDSPPDLDDGRPGLPGAIWNCRCLASPVLPALPD